MEFSNLTHPYNFKSGITAVAYLAPLSWFYSLAKPVPPFDTPGASVTIADDHVFNDYKGFLQFELVPQKNKFDAKNAGDLGSNWFMQSAEIFIPGSYAEAHETVANLLNTPLVALVKDANCEENFYYNLGDDNVSCWLTADFTTSTTKDGAKGYTAKLEASNDAVYMYCGIVVLYIPNAPLAGAFLAEDGGAFITEDGSQEIVSG